MYQQIPMLAITLDQVDAMISDLKNTPLVKTING